MPTVAPYEYEGFVEAAGFLKGEPVFALADGTLRFPAGGEAQAVEAHRGGITAARFDGFAERLLTGGEDGRVVATTGPEDSREFASTGRRWVDGVAGGPNGAIAYRSGRKATVRLADGKIHEIEHPRTVEDVAFAPKGLRLAIARYDGASLFYPATQSAPAQLEWKGAHTGIAFSPDGRFLVTRMQENALHGWRLDDGKHMRMTGYPAKVKSWSWSARGRYLATSGAPAAILWPFAGKDGPMNKAPLELGTRGNAMVTSVACHPDEDMVAIGFNDGLILAVRFVDSREAVLRRGGQSPIAAMNWDKGGRRLAFGSESGEAGVVDLAG
ncbi:WD40 repeat domain-containing protein [Aureimonas leprariae]|uniref:WD40 repeat domain-containing protein n=1 Tax=Plantimonas leprariae TaxID=2615207 RepID=A0A7V7PMH2_9HYPH|nr:PD40 domain-containing protein [Aureimonas leprariae]KAB0677994.1 WD40 repeat domain-containing protein [Aureimonas leprariae]